ncbi:histidine ammonia-lyase [Nocardioides scoriae]|uniref:Histidine ammonia-lyase n=1 Tax=Nocardioides scoriae TaxID=642780 RepID=A0A1H1U0B4_9ACTN|nr:aromatic amino acid lyase [Nocardioides scoriae]SDS65794.1 histidine ammonia-lyase [Nocardioides scoriae]
MEPRVIEAGEGSVVPVVDGQHLGLADIVAASRRTHPVTLAPDARARVARSQAYAAQAASERPVYGRSTGVGANRDVVVPDPDAQSLRLLRSHATSSGERRSTPRVRAMLTIRLNQLAADGNGIRPEVLDALAAMIAADALPPVREGGSVGTADLAALATTALVLAGEVRSVPPAPQTATFGPGDALTFMSSNAAVLADAALAVADLDRLARASLVVAAMDLAAVRGNLEAFSPAVEVATPFPGAQWVCRAVREMSDPTAEPARIQDPFGLRTLPQVHGALMDRLAFAETVVTTMANAPSENPIVSAELGVAHHGGFHAAYLVQSLDALVLALAQAAQLSLARLTMLAEPAYTGLHPFLGDGTPAASGVMIVEYSAASALAELRALATPAGTQVVTLSRGVEEDASFATLAARQALDAVARFRAVIAAELVASLRCLRMQDSHPPALARALNWLDEQDGGVPDTHDRDLTSDLLLAEELVGGLPDLVPAVRR